MAKKWAAHTPKGADLPEHVKKSNLIVGWVINGLEKRAQVPFNQTSADSAYSAGRQIYQNLSTRPAGKTFNHFGGLIGQPMKEALPSAAVNRNWLTRFTQSPQYAQIGKSAPSDTSSINKGLRNLQSGESSLRNNATKWGYARSLWEGGKLLTGRGAVNKAMETTRKYAPQDYQRASSYLGGKTGQGFPGDTASYAKKGAPTDTLPMAPKATAQPPDTTAKR